jgi:hypothetical protein
MISFYPELQIKLHIMTDADLRNIQLGYCPYCEKQSLFYIMLEPHRVSQCQYCHRVFWE